MEDVEEEAPAPLAAPNPEEFKSKDDGMHLIIEPGYSLTTLKEFVKSSCLAEKCQFIDEIDEIHEVNMFHLV